MKLKLRYIVLKGKLPADFSFYMDYFHLGHQSKASDLSMVNFIGDIQLTVSLLNLLITSLLQHRQKEISKITLCKTSYHIQVSTTDVFVISATY